MAKFDSYPQGTFTLEQYQAMTPVEQERTLDAYRWIPEFDFVVPRKAEGVESDAA